MSYLIKRYHNHSPVVKFLLHAYIWDEMRERQGRGRSSLPRLTLSHRQDQKPTSTAPVSRSIQINKTSFCVQQPHNTSHLHCKVAFQGLLKLLTLCLGEAVLHPAPSHTRKAVTANPTLSAAFCTLVCASSFRWRHNYPTGLADQQLSASSSSRHKEFSFKQPTGS